MKLAKLLLATAIFFSVITTPIHATPISGKVPSSYAALVLSNSKADISSASATSFSVTASSAKSRLYLLKDGKLAAPVIAGVKYKGKYYSYAQATKAKLCKKGGTKLIMGLKSSSGTLKVGTIKIKASDGIAYLSSVLKTKNFDSSSATTISNKNKCYPDASGSSLGLKSTSAQSASKKTKKLKAVSGDSDGDGLLDEVDIDEDDDGILNGYDSDSENETIGDGISEAHIFSNLKLAIENSLNLYTTIDGSLSSTELDTAAGQIGLAMQVAGGNVNPTELNCGALNYCSTGGTGTYNGQPFPENYDSDNDGFGTMTVGGTGDFQLQPLVTSSSSINAGDTYVEIVSSAGSTETKVPALLNFVFRTTPAIKSVTMGGVTTTVTYPANQSMSGSTNNPIVAPVAWDGNITITAYRPQRPGITAAGESAYVDIGNSKITVDIPNAPCSSSGGGGGCSGNGPGNCSLSTYSTTDTRITTSGDTLLDTRGDQSSDFLNPTDALLTFTLNLDACLAAQSLTLASGQKVALDLQFRSDDGDNAAQKFYISRP